MTRYEEAWEAFEQPLQPKYKAQAATVVIAYELRRIAGMLSRAERCLDKSEEGSIRVQRVRK